MTSIKLVSNGTDTMKKTVLEPDGESVGMIERVARALWADRYPDVEWESAANIDHMNYSGHARAALEAMREPTFSMIEAGGTEDGEWNPNNSTACTRESWQRHDRRRTS